MVIYVLTNGVLQDHCLNCWDGGNLICCEWCPAAYHPKCVGLNSEDDLSGFGNTWACPHHSCSQCERKAAAAGGLLFRCQMCPQVRPLINNSLATTD